MQTLIFATEQKKLKLACMWSHSDAFRMQCVVPSNRKGYEDDLKTQISKFPLNYPRIYSNRKKTLWHFQHLMNHSAFYELRWIVKDRIEMDNLGYFGLKEKQKKHVEYLQFRNFDPKT